MNALPLRSTLLSLALSATHAVHAEFIPPEDNPSFRRDQLPLDVDTMATLSRQFSLFASTLKPGEPADERSAAQCIAIAIALDPVNRQAINLRESWEDQSKPAEIKEEQISSAKATSWRSYTWLSEKESGKDANTLADCMGDILIRLDPQHPKAESLGGKNGVWSDWVHPLEEFTKKPELVANANTEEQSSEEEKSDQKTEDTEQKVPENATFKLSKTSAKTPLWLFNTTNETYSLKLATVSVSHWTHDEDHDFHFALPDLEEYRTSDIRNAMQKNSKKYLEETFGKLPQGGRISFRCDNNLVYSVKRNEYNLSAPGIAMTHACLSGNEISAIVIGIVDKDKKLSSPKNVWELIRFLETVPASRVVLPKTSEELLPALYTLDKHSLFFKHDIFLADNIEEMMTYSPKKLNENTLSALSQFNEIRTKAPTNIGPFLANPHVLKRLEVIQAACPQYASARFLLVAGKSQRPTYISQKVLAHEIRMAIAPLEEFNEIEEWSIREVDHERALSAHEASRKILDPLERLVSSADRPLFAKALDLSNSARTLARGVKTIAQRYDFDETFHEKSAKASARELQKGLPLLHQEIARLLGQKYIPLNK